MKGAFTMGYFVVRKTNTGVKFDLHAGNHEVIATSEVYASDASCKKGIASVQRNAVVAGVPAKVIKQKDEKTISKTELIDLLRTL